MEGTCSGRYGFIITVTEVLEHGKGKIREGTPQYVSVSALLDAQALLAEACGWRHLSAQPSVERLPNRPRRPRRDISDADGVDQAPIPRGRRGIHSTRMRLSAASPLLQLYTPTSAYAGAGLVMFNMKCAA